MGLELGISGGLLDISKCFEPHSILHGRCRRGPDDLFLHSPWSALAAAIAAAAALPSAALAAALAAASASTSTCSCSCSCDVHQSVR